MPKIKKAEMVLEYQNYIFDPPAKPDDLYKQAASNDESTVNHWEETWYKNIKANHEKYGPFKDNSIGQLWGSESLKPVIVAGSGPSLAKNGHEAKDKGDICLISCLHNFHYFHDNGVKVHYYVSLDAGEVTVGEVSEGGKHSEEDYWIATRDCTLLAYIGSSPNLLEKWQGKILFFNAPVPSPAFEDRIAEIETFNLMVSSGGNVLGACAYIAKAVMGANPLVFMGADFCFGYDKRFHGWDSSYDKDIGVCVRTNDVFGNKVLTWQSYHGFKCFFDWVATVVPGTYINCTEGGTFGAYPEGNLVHIKQMDFCDFLEMYNVHHNIKDNCFNPDTAQKKVLY